MTHDELNQVEDFIECQCFDGLAEFTSVMLEFRTPLIQR